jgi:hypothetical protein
MTTDTDRLDFYTHDLEPHLKSSTTFLGNLDFSVNFKAQDRNRNQIFVDPTTNTEKTFLIFGEVATAERGTKLGAIGNHYQGGMKSDNTVCLLTFYLLPSIHHSRYHISPFPSETNHLQRTYLSFANRMMLQTTSRLFFQIKQFRLTKQYSPTKRWIWQQTQYVIYTLTPSM